MAMSRRPSRRTNTLRSNASSDVEFNIVSYSARYSSASSAHEDPVGGRTLVQSETPRCKPPVEEPELILPLSFGTWYRGRSETGAASPSLPPVSSAKSKLSAREVRHKTKETQGCEVFYLDGSTGEKVPLPSDVTHGSTVGLVLELVAENLEVPPDQIQLSWNGRYLDTSRTLMSYRIQSGQCLHVRRRRGAGPPALASERSCLGASASLMFSPWASLGPLPSAPLPPPPPGGALGVEFFDASVDARVATAAMSARAASAFRSAYAPRGRPLAIVVRAIDDSLRPLVARFRIEGGVEDKVIDVKRRVERESGVPAGDQRLSLNGVTLTNDRRLLDYGIFHESEVQLQLLCPFSRDLPMTVLERTANTARSSSTCIERPYFSVVVREVWPPGRKLRCRLQSDGPIRHIKEQVKAWNGMGSAEQMLLHRGRELDEGLTANYYNLEGGDCIELAAVGGLSPVGYKPKPLPMPLRPKEPAGVIAARARKSIAEARAQLSAELAAEVAAMEAAKSGEALPSVEERAEGEDEDADEDEAASEAMVAMTSKRSRGSRRLGRLTARRDPFAVFMVRGDDDEDTGADKADRGLVRKYLLAVICRKYGIAEAAAPDGAEFSGAAGGPASSADAFSDVSGSAAAEVATAGQAASDAAAGRVEARDEDAAHGGVGEAGAGGGPGAEEAGGEVASQPPPPPVEGEVATGVEEHSSATAADSGDASFEAADGEAEPPPLLLVGGKAYDGGEERREPGAVAQSAADESGEGELGAMTEGDGTEVPSVCSIAGGGGDTAAEMLAPASGDGEFEAPNDSRDANFDASS